MGERARSDDDSRDESGSRRSPGSGSTTDGDRRRDVPPARGHEGTLPRGTGIDRMAAQHRTRRERELGPATVDRMAADGDLDPDPSGFRAEARAVAADLSPVGGADGDRSADDGADGNGRTDDGTDGKGGTVDGADRGGGTTDGATDDATPDAPALRVHRFPGQGRLKSAREAATGRFAGTGGNQAPTDPRKLARDVSELKANQERIMSRMGGDSSLEGELSEAAGQGAVGAALKPLGEVGGMVALGTAGGMVAGPPGMAAAGAAGKQFGGPIAADVGKRVYAEYHADGAEKLKDAAGSVAETARDGKEFLGETVGGIVSRPFGSEDDTGKGSSQEDELR